MLTRYPEQFGVLFCTMPVIEMRRYDKLLISLAITMNREMRVIPRTGNSLQAFPPIMSPRRATPIHRL